MPGLLSRKRSSAVTNMQLRRLTPSGLERFASLLEHARQGHNPDFVALRDDPTFTEIVVPNITLGAMPSDSKLEVGRYLCETLEPITVDASVDRDAGLWAWIALAWIDSLAPVDASGKRNVLSDYRWIPMVDSARRYYRHLLIVPFMVYSAHRADPNVAMVLLGGRVQQPGDANEHLASRQEILSSAALIGAATALYYDGAAGKIKSGFSDRGPGSVQRFGLLLNQYVLTWDLHEKAPDDVISLLPKEFDRFRPKKGKSKLTPAT
jgi:hypothetical protein